jgi:hypothetical protein
MKRHGWKLTWCGAWTWAALAASPVVAQPRPVVPPAVRPLADPATAVQLAWMADPTLFPYALSARVRGTELVVSGVVPNERVQWQAVRVAQRMTPLPVIDEVKLNPRLPLPAPVFGNPAELEHRAAATITAALGARANNIRVFGGAAGRVTLTGTVTSAGDLLVAGACLRLLPGCGSVDNRLVVTPPSGVVTAAMPAPWATQTSEPPLVAASAQVRVDGPALPEPMAPAPPPAPSVLRSEAAASAKALPGSDSSKRQPPPVTLLASATRTAGDSDMVMPAVVLHRAPALAAPIGDILPAAPAAKPVPQAARPQTPAGPPSPPRIVSAEQLRTELDAACHGLAGDLQVQLTDDQHVAVTLRLRSMLDWDWVRARIRAVTDSAGLTATFNVTVKP